MIYISVAINAVLKQSTISVAHSYSALEQIIIFIFLFVKLFLYILNKYKFIYQKSFNKYKIDYKIRKNIEEKVK